MDNQWEQPFAHRFQQLVYAELEPLGFTVAGIGAPDDVARLGAVTVYAALRPEFFKGYPHSEMGKHHRKGRGAALRRLHLEDCRNLYARDVPVEHALNFIP